MSNLCVFAKKYGSDKCPTTSGRLTHTYTPEYDKLFSPLRESTTSLLEIGIGNYPLMSLLVDSYVPGASIKMWRDYFNNAIISTCDILPNVLFEEDRINSYLCDQSNPTSLLEMCASIKLKTNIDSFDIIIDDGSHIKEHQTISFMTLWPFLRNGGLYIIEDIYVDTIPHFLELHSTFKAEIVKLHRGTSNWDNFIAYKKLG